MSYRSERFVQDPNYVANSTSQEERMFPRGYTGAPPIEEVDDISESNCIQSNSPASKSTGNLAGFPVLGFASKVDPSIEPIANFGELTE